MGGLESQVRFLVLSRADSRSGALVRPAQGPLTSPLVRCRGTTFWLWFCPSHIMLPSQHAAPACLRPTPPPPHPHMLLSPFPRAWVLGIPPPPPCRSWQSCWRGRAAGCARGTATLCNDLHPRSGGCYTTLRLAQCNAPSTSEVLLASSFGAPQCGPWPGALERVSLLGRWTRH